ncbi:hypothetical protein SAMN05660493_03208 [Epilithonimonas bovis DSM 19482]|jgi:hypothetical protein|uniref:Type IV secretion system putative lipoprotein virB7 n=1 Tax=Epilithonimonas bovis DSM 19482 TaxID=1121284 RepID=A0A1U7Q1F5_9FLAO|nr:DUF6452 family protein [Epilithonimonas bovis]SIT98651.1 hypothetical protein SAMN05660493_03208 [Epilithonimonas bovis DSM 19482]
MQKIFFLIGFLLLLTSCGGDDDICLNADSTPRLKLKFINASGQLLRLDSLYIDVDYGGSTLKNIVSQANADSVFVPMRIDESSYTDIYLRLRKAGNRSKIRVSYDKKAIYVSPACGFKINYDNLKSELLQANPVQNVEQNQTSLSDESKINFYLRF